MGRIMTITAAFEAFQQRRVVGLAVTSLATDYIPMFGMTFRAGKRAVFGLAGPKLVQSLGMASSTGFLCRCDRISYNQWSVNRMASKAIGVRLSL